MKKRYRFGYLFVKVAKGLALLLILSGIGFCVVQYSQADTAASAAAYQTSASLQRALERLKQVLAATEHDVTLFNANNELTTPRIESLRFPALINSNADFAAVDKALSRVDQERQQLKQSIVTRFEASVKTIEEKLRAHAAQLESLPRPTAASLPTPIPTPTPARAPAQEQESLFSSALSADEVNKRSVILNRRKEFLKVLENKAENPENRATLTEAVDQLELFGKLLPEKTNQSEPISATGNQSAAEEGRNLFLSERVGNELGQLRSEVRQIVLTSWTLDDALEQAADLNSAEREKCRVSTLSQKGIWLSGISRIFTGLLVAIIGSFLILVCADLVATFLDTAESTGVVADAINALRGSVAFGRGEEKPPKV